tara:strand:+ start:1835 stop:2533 length:699 start_codon:yes stop_codon:yes gene_type:complete
MLYEEAIWLGEQLKAYTSSESKLLNIGSSTLTFRTIEQPHMAKYIFQPLETKGAFVVHSDISTDEGVDLIGDFTDPKFIQLLSEKQFEIVLCCNLLEHLEDRSLLVNALNKIIPTNGCLVLTVPYQYPYHMDPIDTLYRPSVDDLLKLFSGFEKIEGEIITARRYVLSQGVVKFHKNYFQQLKESPKLMLRLFARSFIPFYKPKMWLITIKDLLRIFKPFQVTCVILKATKK